MNKYEKFISDFDPDSEENIQKLENLIKDYPYFLQPKLYYLKILKDKKSKKYEAGVSCPKCYDTLTNTQKSRFRMRQKQIMLAKKAGRKHIFQKEFK